MSGNNTRYPTYYAFKLLKFFARGGDRMVQAGSDNKLLAVEAFLLEILQAACPHAAFLQLFNKLANTS